MIKETPEKFFMEWNIKYFDYDKNKYNYFVDRFITNNKQIIEDKKKECESKKQNYYIYELTSFKKF